ncbi:MAG TPA: hypothetical protein VFW09_09660 [Solirubrobacteraceae bacterium]|nr:hypothetical protein [Solirubrobacteraceae bacterium]
MPKSTRTDRLQTIVVAALVACGCTLAVAACGGGSSGSGDANGGSKPGKYQSALKFSKCMRAHGVPNFPDPSTQGGGLSIKISPSNGVDPSAPAFRSAEKACQHLLPGLVGNQKPTEQAKQRMLALANCMRAHGLTNFPDPTTRTGGAPPSPGPGAVLGIDGLFFNLGAAGLNPQSPAFLQAAKACNFPGAGGGGGSRAPANGG